MVREIYKNIFSFPVTLPKSPLKEINIYVIKGEDRTVVLDTGYNMPQSEADMRNGLTQLGLDLRDVELVITHLHADHTGLTTKFYDSGCKIYASKIDGAYFNSMATGEYWDLINSFKKLYGIGDTEIDITDNPGFNYKLDRPVEYEILTPGENFSVGDYNFEILDLKGHTPGHIGLYEKNHKILFGADTVLDPITPNITFWGFKYKDILGEYMDTLRYLRSMDIDYIFPTHRKIITDHVTRIDELLHHHYVRMQEILDVMDYDKQYTVRDISAVITWNIRADSWDDFPKPQKWFATGETMSHMEHLYSKGYLKMIDDNGTLKFNKLKNSIEQA